MKKIEEAMEHLKEAMDGCYEVIADGVAPSGLRCEIRVARICGQSKIVAHDPESGTEQAIPGDQVDRVIGMLR